VRFEALLATDSPRAVADILHRLELAQLAPVVTISLDKAARLVGEWKPDVAIVVSHRQDPALLLRRLEECGVPVVLVIEPERLDDAAAGTIVTAVSPSAGPAAIARAAEIAAGVGGLPTLPPIVEVGPLRIDARSRRIFVGGEEVELPPKEFAVLVALALRRGEPVSSAELLTSVWDPADPATQDDVHRHVYRLRKLIHDHERVPPLVRNRRGFGYVLGHS
jgi:DNA-binding response OmpR family regulator